MKKLKNAHTSNTKLGQGDFYGTGVKNPMAKSRSVLGNKVVGGKVKKPRSLA